MNQTFTYLGIAFCFPRNFFSINPRSFFYSNDLTRSDFLSSFFNVEIIILSQKLEIERKVLLPLVSKVYFYDWDRLSEEKKSSVHFLII